MNREIEQPGAAYLACKRMLDVAGALVGLLFAAPLLIACAAWIHAMDRGPVLYTQWRVGRDGWLFRIYKLRTMLQDAEKPGDAKFAISDDDRIIRGCSWMRRTHIDELPQLWNILIGDMSIVGPRPERPEMYDKLTAAMPQFEERLAGKPGLTGLAQVRNGYTNDIEGARRKLAFDLAYLRQPSILGDLKLILATAPCVWDEAAL